MALFLAVLVPLWAFGQPEHVSFLVMGKTTNHRQLPREMKLLNYHFFAEIFVRERGRVTNASLSFPNGDVRKFDDLGYVLELHGGRYGDEETLDRNYPKGDYTFRYDTPSGAVDGRVLKVRATGQGRSRIPAPPRITLLQGGREVQPDSVDPDRDLIVTWSDFRDAGSDENGILDDLVFVVLGNCHGEKTVHSGRPFEGTPFLTYETKEYVIPAEKLTRGEPHQMFVEHAVVDTSREDDVVGLVTYASTTFLDFRTTGEPAGARCPADMPKIDQGQTDRKDGEER
jgi:hypothetical protein